MKSTDVAKKKQISSAVFIESVLCQKWSNLNYYYLRLGIVQSPPPPRPPEKDNSVIIYSHSGYSKPLVNLHNTNVDVF